MLIPITRPAEPAVPLARAMAHLRVEGPEYEAEVEPYLAAAIAFVERRTSRVLAPATYELRTNGWCYDPVEIPLWPVREVTEVRYLDPAGAEQTLAPADWWWQRTASGAIVAVEAAAHHPLLPRPGSVRYRLEAGCDPMDATGTGDDPELALPPQAMQAVLLLTGHWFERRTPVSVAQGVTVTELPFAAQALLEQMRIFR